MIFGVLLLSAVNTAIVAVIGVFYMMSLDGEFPRPWWTPYYRSDMEPALATR